MSCKNSCETVEKEAESISICNIGHCDSRECTLILLFRMNCFSFIIGTHNSRIIFSLKCLRKDMKKKMKSMQNKTQTKMKEWKRNKYQVLSNFLVQ